MEAPLRGKRFASDVLGRVVATIISTWSTSRLSASIRVLILHTPTVFNTS